jgi:3-oxoacyl-[acyl-carrier protein] reductase
VLLENRNAIVYGVGGIGRAVARAFAREGATVHLAGRTRDRVEAAADEIRAAGGRAEAAQLDALDAAAVDAHADRVAAEAGSVDVSINLISYGDVQGTPLAGMAVDDFMRPIVDATRSTFVTARAAARHMIEQRSGVILTYGGTGDPMRDYYIGGFQIALGAAELLCKQLAAELGPHGIRALTIVSGGVPETIPDDFEGRDALVESLAAPTMLGRTATLDDVGNVAVFAASDLARTLTATVLNTTCGTIVD